MASNHDDHLTGVATFKVQRIEKTREEDVASLKNYASASKFPKRKRPIARQGVAQFRQVNLGQTLNLSGLMDSSQANESPSILPKRKRTIARQGVGELRQVNLGQTLNLIGLMDSSEANGSPYLPTAKELQYETPAVDLLSLVGRRKNRDNLHPGLKSRPLPDQDETRRKETLELTARTSLHV
ncbi:hypothetical protein SUGI_1199420 [Cryptomeria japonica]|uniref:uncharacterized protein LOC131038157 isoform X2 n=1 Tax=Cryptomeria japonica TaxID=3369 RepID=UPI0024148436|nr:uncharacterized protein LOC131038157 isoform X2 [Cryptomeria japonica]GLJ55857.1 hypothetical protein SUGI_1199420 [Cryptomeria japonica]